jgi:hypothetical protein
VDLVKRQLLLIMELNLSTAKYLQATSNFVIESVEEKVEEVDRLLLI